MSYRVEVRTKLGIISAEAEDQSEAFKAVAGIVEVFDEEKCGLCGTEELKPVVRRNKEEDDFFEVRCKKCGGYLALGQNKKGGGLFPIRQLTEAGKPSREEGQYGKHNGWTKYRGEPKPEGQPVQQKPASKK